MDKSWHRSTNKYLHKKGFPPKEIHVVMNAILEDDVSTLSTVKIWAADFKKTKENLEDYTRSGSLVTVTTEENIARLHHIRMDVRRLTLNQIDNAVIITRERIDNILDIKLGNTKICFRWMPRFLTINQMRPT